MSVKRLIAHALILYLLHLIIRYGLATYKDCAVDLENREEGGCISAPDSEVAKVTGNRSPLGECKSKCCTSVLNSFSKLSPPAMNNIWQEFTLRRHANTLQVINLVSCPRPTSLCVYVLGFYLQGCNYGTVHDIVLLSSMTLIKFGYKVLQYQNS